MKKYIRAKGDKPSRALVLRGRVERQFRDAYEIAFGVNPSFNVNYLTNEELHGRTALIKATAGEYPI